MIKLYTLIISLLFCLKAEALICTFDKGGDGVSWSDAANWTLNIMPGPNDTVMIQYDSIRLNTTVSIKRLVLFNNNPNSIFNAVLVITNNGSLTINNGQFLISGPTNGPNVGLRNSGSIFLNNATLSNAAGYTIINNPTGYIEGINDSYIGIGGDFRNTEGGQILMYNNTNEAISCGGRLINRGTIEIKDTEDGIKIPVGGQVLNEGTFLIHDISPNYGVYIQGGALKNKGVFEIYNTTDFGIKESTAFPPGVLLNDTTGTLKVLSGIYFYGSITNNGNMEAKAFGKPSLETYGTLTNNDSLTISIRNTNVGMRLNGPYTSGPDAYLLGKDIFVEPPHLDVFLIEFLDTMHNEGVIDINLKNKAKGIYFFSNQALNEGTIKVRNTNNTAIDINAKFENLPGGSIVIDSVLVETSVGSPGVGALLLRDTLINEGAMRIEHLGEIGLYTYQGAFVQNAGNVFFRNNIGVKTVTAIEHTKGKFINEEDGSITFENLDNASKIGQNPQPVIDNGSIFENYGSISFQDCQLNYQILNKTLAGNDNAYFYNNHQISAFNTSTTQNAITSSATFLNDSCGTLELVGNLSLVSPNGYLLNHGLVNFSNFTGISNLPLFESDGIIVGQDKHWLGYFDSDNSLVFPVSTALKNTRKYSTGILLAGNKYTVKPTVNNSNSFFENVGIYTENYLSVNTTQVIKETIDYLFEQTPGCVLRAKTIAKDFDFQCHQIRESVFVGTDDNWFLPDNWSDGFVPDYCSNVIIPSGKKVKISPNFHVVINKIKVENGAVFDAQNASILEVNDSK